MHIVDSICGDCKHFEHDCGNGNGCFEFCNHPKSRTRERFVDADDSILKCGDFEED